MSHSSPFDVATVHLSLVANRLRSQGVRIGAEVVETYAAAELLRASERIAEVATVLDATEEVVKDLRTELAESKARERVVQTQLAVARRMVTRLGGSADELELAMDVAAGGKVET